MSVEIAKMLEELREDHRNIALLLNLLELDANRIDDGEEPDFELLHDIMRYMTVYSDAIHHPREDLLYSTMQIHDVGPAEKLETVESDHHDIAQLGIQLRDDIEAVQSGVAVTRIRLSEDIDSYVTRLRNHIQWEEDELFPRADALVHRNADLSVDVSSLSDGDPVFGNRKSDGFPNLLAHLQRTTGIDGSANEPEYQGKE